MRATITKTLGVMLAVAAAIGVPEADAATQLRGMQATSRRLIADGLGRSPTIRRLAGAIEASDVIVYVDVRRDLPSHLVGSMRFLTRTATHRVLRVSLNQQYDWPTLLAYLGHELQHACEVASAAGVDSADRLRAHYREFGMRVDRDAYETREAQAVTRRVASELRGRTSETGRLAALQQRTF